MGRNASGCVSLRKSNIGFLNPKESENGFWVSLPNRFFGSWFVEETEESLHSRSGFFRSFDAPRSERSWINLLSKETQNPSSDFLSLRFKNLILDFLKETHVTIGFSVIEFFHAYASKYNIPRRKLSSAKRKHYQFSFSHP